MVLVVGGLDDGSENAPIAAELARHFTVYNYARRGRGGGGDTAPYAVAREIDDIQALIGAAGGSAHVFGASSGGALALEAAAAGSAIDRIAVYEVPYMSDAFMAKRWSTYVDDLTVALAEGGTGTRSGCLCGWRVRPTRMWQPHVTRRSGLVCEFWLPPSPTTQPASVTDSHRSPGWLESRNPSLWRREASLPST